jgi:hypothetical protein
LDFPYKRRTESKVDKKEYTGKEKGERRERSEGIPRIELSLGARKRRPWKCSLEVFPP